jgi:hypothetical protein
MAIDTTTQRSRRALLLGAAGGVAAAVAGGLGLPTVVDAHDPDDVRLGSDNSAGGLTTIINTDGSAFAGYASGTGTGVLGNSVAAPGVAGSGVVGLANSGYGVVGQSNSGPGVYALSTENNGVLAYSQTPTASGVYGENFRAGYGITGRSNAPALIAGAGAAASLGDNTADGIGVWARSAHGIALFADAANSDAVSLKATGVAQFKRSGKLTVAAGSGSVTRTGIRIDPGTLVLATLQQDRPGVFVRSAVPNAAGDSFTVRLNKAVGSDTMVGWFLVN